LLSPPPQVLTLERIVTTVRIRARGYIWYGVWVEVDDGLIQGWPRFDDRWRVEAIATCPQILLIRYVFAFPVPAFGTTKVAVWRVSLLRTIVNRASASLCLTERAFVVFIPLAILLVIALELFIACRTTLAGAVFMLAFGSLFVFAGAQGDDAFGLLVACRTRRSTRTFGWVAFGAFAVFATT